MDDHIPIELRTRIVRGTQSVPVIPFNKPVEEMNLTNLDLYIVLDTGYHINAGMIALDKPVDEKYYTSAYDDCIVKYKELLQAKNALFTKGAGFAESVYLQKVYFAEKRLSVAEGTYNELISFHLFQR